MRWWLRGHHMDNIAGAEVAPAPGLKDTAQIVSFVERQPRVLWHLNTLGLDMKRESQQGCLKQHEGWSAVSFKPTPILRARSNSLATEPEPLDAKSHCPARQPYGNAHIAAADAQPHHQRERIY